MGNIICSDLLSNAGKSGDVGYRVKRGRHVIIDLSGRKVATQKNGGFSEKWTMSYYVDVSGCDLELTRHFSNRGEVKGLCLKLHSESSKRDGNTLGFDFRLDVDAVPETDVLVNPHWFAANGSHTTTTWREYKVVHAGGSVTETDAYLYGVQHKGGLVVVERKKKSSADQLPYALSVAHYHATSAGINDYAKTEADFGLSVVAKIRAAGGQLFIAVEGPEQHPAAALFYMFDQLNRTYLCSPPMCPHCTDNPRQRSIMLWQSSSEDNNDVSEAPRLYSRQSKIGIANDGALVGNGIRNFIDKKVMVSKGRKAVT